MRAVIIINTHTLCSDRELWNKLILFIILCLVVENENNKNNRNNAHNVKFYTEYFNNKREKCMYTNNLNNIGY